MRFLNADRVLNPFLLCLLSLLASRVDAQSSAPRAAAAAPRTGLAATTFGWVYEGYKLAPESNERVVDVLAAHADSAAVLGSLAAGGADPRALAWSSLGSLSAREAAEVSPELLPAIDQFESLRRGINEILAPVDLALLRVETWIGFAGSETGPADRVMLLVATLPNSDVRLIYGRHDHLHDGVAQVAEFEGTFVDEAAANELSPLAGIKWNKVKDKWGKFKQCFKTCIMASAPALTTLQVICLVAGAVGCIPATGGWAACFTGAAAFCGLGFLGLQITACGLYALGC